MEKKEKVFLIGAGDHAKVVLSILEACGVGCAGIYDDNSALWGKTLWCLPILGPVSAMPDTADTMAVIAIGANDARRAIAGRFRNVCWPVFVHPLGIVHSSVRLGEGTIVFAGCIIESDASIGRQTIVESSSYIGHDTGVGSFCHLAPRATIGNNVTIGDNVAIDMGAKVKPYLRIGNDVLIDTGSAVMDDITAAGEYGGIPARKKLPFVVHDTE